MRKLTLLAVSAALMISAGCLPDTSGVDPPNDEIIFPTGLAVTNGGGHLIVANSNFDLMYNAGTLLSIKLSGEGGLSQLLEQLPELIANDPEKYAGWVSKDKKDLYIPEDMLIDSDNTARTGSFASDLKLTPNGDRAIIPIRSERSILLVDLNTGGRVLSCGQGDDRRCDSEHKVTSNDRYSLPIEPYEVASLTYDTLTLGFATHLYGGEVSLYLIDKNGKLWPDLLKVTDDVVPGASGIAVNPIRQEIYVTGRHDPVPHISIMEVKTDSETGALERDPYFEDVDSIRISDDMYAGTDARGMAVTKSGDTAFLITRSPEALLKIDLEERRLDDITTLGSEPSVVSVLEDDNETPDDPADDVSYAFVLCFLSDQVYIVEPEMMQVLVRTTGYGPHAVVFDYERHWAYIANFRDSTITLLETTWPFEHVSVRILDPNGETKENYIEPNVRIGKPELPKGHS
jgi:DNA-binding beta-propeller fold protein YncE